MLRQITAYLLLTAFLLQSFGTGLYYLDYYRNRSEYAKNCINKLRPYLHCNGKCQLMKKLQQQQKKEEQERKEDRANAGQIFPPARFISAAAGRPECLLRLHYMMSSDGDPCDRSYPFFHPPGHLNKAA